MSASVVAIRCRTADRAPGPIRGVEALAPMVANRLGVEPRAIGTGATARTTAWVRDLEESRGCLLEAGGQVEDALRAGRAPVVLASDCSIALTTLPTVARLRSDARVLWLDAHGDFNTPDTTRSGFLGGMALAGACGLWPTGFDGALPPERVVLVGVRDLEPAERELLAHSGVTVVGASLETLVFTQNALDRSAVYVHLDLDVLDPATFPAWMPAPGGLSPDKLYDLLEAVAAECEIVGLELSDVEAGEDPLEARAAASTALHVLEPLLEAVAAPPGGRRLGAC
ncbi:MAG: arginase family protein [Actinomycetota bacterium]|nr:arginase family protein [Actinomycetota bacterium]